MRMTVRASVLVLFLAAACSGGATPGTAGSSVRASAAPHDAPAPHRYKGGSLAPQGGTITGVLTSTGLLGGGTSGRLTLSADTTYLQRRVSSTCSTGTAIGTINSDGTVVCNAAGSSGVTNIATTAPLAGGPITSTGTISLNYSSNFTNNAGALDLGTAVIAPGTLAVMGLVTLDAGVTGLPVNTCSAGTFVSSIDTTGTATCSTPSGGGNISGTLTTGDMVVATGTTAIGPYGGSTPSACPAGQAVISVALSAGGVLTTPCTSVPQGTVTSLTFSAPLTGGTVTTSGTAGLSYTSNFALSGSSLNLSTSVSMPGSLVIQDVYDTVISQTLAAGTVTWTTNAGASYISLTCNAAGTTISTITAPSTAGRTIDVTLAPTSGTCTFATGGNVQTPGGIGSFPFVGGESFRLAWGGTNWFLETRGMPAHTCGAGSHISAIDAAGNTTCTADAGGITGALTNGDLVIATGTSTVGPYAGSTCGAGTAATGIGATGALTCGITPVTGALTSGVVPLANGTNSLTNSNIDLNDGTHVGFFTGGTDGPYFDSNSLNFSWAGTSAVGWINKDGSSGGTGAYRTLDIGDGKTVVLASFTGAANSTITLGTGTTNTRVNVGSTSGWYVVSNNGSLDCNEALNANGTCVLGATGYNYTTTWYRDLEIEDGKGAEIAEFVGEGKPYFIVGNGGTTGDFYISQDGGPSCGYNDVSDSLNCGVDFNGYQDSTAHTRNFYVYDGKQNAIAAFLAGSSGIGSLKLTGPLLTTSTSPTCVGCTVTTGSSATAGKITMPSASSTSLTLSFGYTYNSAPFCVCGNAGSASTEPLTFCTTTTTSITFNATSATSAGVFTYVCVGS